MVFFVTIVHGDVSPRTFSRRFYFCGAVDRKNGSRWSYVMCFDMTSLFVNEWISVCRKEELSFHKYISERICTKFWLCKFPYHHLEGIPSDPEAVMSSAQVLLLIPKVMLWWTCIVSNYAGDLLITRFVMTPYCVLNANGECWIRFVP